MENKKNIKEQGIIDNKKNKGQSKTDNKNLKKPEAEETEKKAERRLEKDILRIIIFIAVLGVIFFIATLVFKSLNVINYEGLTFTKERLGEIPVFHYYDYFVNEKGTLIKYNFYLRNDPRELDLIPVNGTSIVFEKGEIKKPTFISVNPSGFFQCKQSALAIGSLTRYLLENDIEVRGSSLTEEQSNITKQEFVTCENKQKNTVIQIQKGEETMINVQGKCIDVKIANCQMLETIERLKLQIVLDAKKTDPEGKITVS